MARMHSRKKGKSGSVKPENQTKPAWLTYTEIEVEQIVAKLAKDGNTGSEIGLILRDSYGIPDVKLVTGKTLTKILEEKGILGDIPEDLLALMKRLVQINSHLQQNKKDMPALRGYQLTDSKIKRLIKYYKSKRRLPVDWAYDLKSIKLLTQ